MTKEELYDIVIDSIIESISIANDKKVKYHIGNVVHSIHQLIYSLQSMHGIIDSQLYPVGQIHPIHVPSKSIDANRTCSRHTHHTSCLYRILRPWPASVGSYYGPYPYQIWIHSSSYDVSDLERDNMACV